MKTILRIKSDTYHLILDIWYSILDTEASYLIIDIWNFKSETFYLICKTWCFPCLILIFVIWIFLYDNGLLLQAKNSLLLLLILVVLLPISKKDGSKLSKLLEMDQNISKWIKNCHYDSNGTNWYNWFKMVQNGSKVKGCW